MSPAGEVSELVDEHDLGSCAERRGSSSLPFPTTSLTKVFAPRLKLESCSLLMTLGLTIER